MTDYEYEKVEFTDLIEMLQAIKGGWVYAVSDCDGSNYHLLHYRGYAVTGGEVEFSIDFLMKLGRFYERIESPWWEKHVGRLVAVKDSDMKEWKYRIFKCKSDAYDYPWRCAHDNWKQMRPLTQAEKDAIITEG